MQLKEIQTLHAETPHEALLLANLARRRGWMPAWVKCIWKLTLPERTNGGQLMAALDLARNLPPHENNMAERMGL